MCLSRFSSKIPPYCIMIFNSALGPNGNPIKASSGTILLKENQDRQKRLGSCKSSVVISPTVQHVPIKKPYVAAV